MSPVHWYKGQALLKELGRREFLKELALLGGLVLGVSSPEQIQLVADGPESEEFAGKVREILLKG